MKNTFIIGIICLSGVHIAQAAIESVASGNWTNTATWGGSVVPASNDVVYVNAHSVTSSTPVAVLKNISMLSPSARLEMESGSDITINGHDFLLDEGVVSVGTGANLSFLTPGAFYVRICRDAGPQAATLDINGGTFYTDKVILNGAQNTDDSTSTINVSAGLFQTVNRLIFGGAANAVSAMNITGGTAEINWIDFDQSTTQGDVGQSHIVTIDGGHMILTTSNQDGSLAWAGDYSKVFYETGSITWKGVVSEAEFYTFTNTFNSWVDAGYVTSAVHSASALKSMLQYYGAAILVDSTSNLPPVRVTSVASGAWTNDAIWDLGFTPRDGDSAWIMDDDVTAAGVVKSLNYLALLNNQQGTLSLTAGTDISVSKEITIMDGEVTVGTGASLSKIGNPDTHWTKIARDAGTTGTLTINGGTYNSTSAIFNTQWNSANTTGTITVVDGSIICDRQLIFGGASNSVSKMFVNGGTAQFSYIDFDQNPVIDPGGGTQTEEVTVDGGDLILTTDDYTNAVQFAGSYSKLFYEGGSITIAGVKTPSDFNAYIPLFNNAVDAQYIDSATFTDEELKSMLQYGYLGGAILTTDEVPGYGTMTISAGTDSVSITSTSLAPAATNMLQVKTDLSGSSWVDVSFSTGSTSNTWVITPLTTPEAFYQIIAE